MKEKILIKIQSMYCIENYSGKPEDFLSIQGQYTRCPYNLLGFLIIVYIFINDSVKLKKS